MAPIDVAGKRFSRLVAIERVPGPKTRWLFRCDCGEQIEAQLHHVKSGRQKSCGCLRREVTQARSITHGHSVGRSCTTEYLSWTHAKGRCFNPTDKKFPDYGARGITMCDEWRDSFKAFLADMGKKPRGTSLDRIDVNGNYEPDNCRWATDQEQVTNRRPSVFVETVAGPVPLVRFAKKMAVPYKALHARIRRGEEPYDAARAILRNINR